jgi:hypothetical protein
LEKIIRHYRKSMNYVLSHHLGMGDHIILNGLVRHIYNREKDSIEKFFLPCFDRNERNVRAMYADLPKLDLIVLEDSPTSGLQLKIDSIPGRKESVDLNAAQMERYHEIGDDVFFDDFGYDNKLIQEFYIAGLENLKGKKGRRENFAFIHDSGYPINEDLIENPNKVRPDKTTPLFDYLPQMFAAKEIHVISSAFLCLCIAIPELAKKTTAHLYARNPYLKNYVESKGIKVIA